MMGAFLSFIGAALTQPRRAAQRVTTPTPTPLQLLQIIAAAAALFLTGVGLIENGIGRDIATIFNETMPYMRQIVLRQAAASGQAVPEIFAQPLMMAPLDPLAARVFGTLVSFFTLTAILGGLSYALGRLAGGKGEPLQLMSAVGGWLLGVFAPLILVIYALSSVLQPETLVQVGFVFMFGWVYGLYLLASFIAEAHRFKSTLTVFLLLIIASFSLPSLLGGLSLPAAG